MKKYKRVFQFTPTLLIILMKMNRCVFQFTPTPLAIKL